MRGSLRDHSSVLSEEEELEMGPSRLQDATISVLFFLLDTLLAVGRHWRGIVFTCFAAPLSATVHAVSLLTFRGTPLPFWAETVAAAAAMTFVWYSVREAIMEFFPSLYRTLVWPRSLAPLCARGEFRAALAFFALAGWFALPVAWMWLTMFYWDTTLVTRILFVTSAFASFMFLALGTGHLFNCNPYLSSRARLN